MNTIIFLIITIVPLIITILYYFGVFRYFKMHGDSEKYINNYKNLNKETDNKVVISITTTPENIKKLRPTLNSILDQTVKVDQIALNIPDHGKKYEIPDDYYKILNIYRGVKNYGPSTKFIPTLLREDDNDIIIILLHDNYIYGEDFIHNIIKEYEKYNDDAIISKKAILIKPKFIDSSIIYNDDDYLDDDWIINKIKTNKKDFNYSQNYKSMV